MTQDEERNRRKREPAYAYIQRAYGRAFKIGQRVAFVEEGCRRREGVVRRPIASAEHYVAILFDGDRHKVPCHPTSVEVIHDTR